MGNGEQMTNSNYTHLSLVVDRSASMDIRKKEATNAINNLFDEQKKVPGKLTVDLTQFDNVIDELFNMKDINEVPKYELVPRGMTALLDAVGKAIVSTGDALFKLPEDERPGKVLVTIVTDGEENSSHDWTLGQIQKLIKQQKEDYDWEFLFLGADDSAWLGKDLGIQNTYSYDSNAGGTQAVYGSFTKSLSGYRSGSSHNLAWVGDIN
jgi:uncharacterized protein YegL